MCNAVWEKNSRENDSSSTFFFLKRQTTTNSLTKPERGGSENRSSSPLYEGVTEIHFKVPSQTARTRPTRKQPATIQTSWTRLKIPVETETHPKVLLRRERLLPARMQPTRIQTARTQSARTQAPTIHPESLNEYIPNFKMIDIPKELRANHDFVVKAKKKRRKTYFFHLDGETEIRFPKRSNLNLLHILTITTWIRVEEFRQGMILVDSTLGGNLNGFGINLFNPSTKGLRNETFLRFCLGNTCFRGYRPLRLNTWYHVAVKFDLTHHVTFFVNGIPDARHLVLNPILQNTLDFVIGGVVSGTATKFKGSIDDLRIWNRVLSNREIIKTIFNSKIICKSNCAPCGPILDLSFDEGNGSQIFDLSEFGHVGRIYGLGNWSDSYMGKPLVFSSTL
eukprot:TRINITY_DN7446_c0_g1_i6.p1 TRINITY_DN7446_c0_g1~~TRINITY_DN7446_c0_g1_i6.p1  ORF type:complete len:394 (+),score=63.71 TRINITY_DN7446_c0_g1_i6:1320-2501(+)